MPSARTPPARLGPGCAPPTPTRRRMARHPRRRWRSATWRRQPAARPTSPPTAQRCPIRAARSPASRPRPQPPRPTSPPHTRPVGPPPRPPPTRPAGPPPRPPHTRPAGPPPRPPPTRPSRLAPRDPPRAGTGGARRHGAAGCSSHLQAARGAIAEQGRPTYPARRPRPVAVPDPRLRASVLFVTAADAWGRHGSRRIATMFSGITRPGRFGQAGRDKRPAGLWLRRCRRLGAVAGRRGVTVTRSPALVLL